MATDLVLVADAGNPADIPDAVRLMFEADDTDGNPSTCSPDIVELVTAAIARNIPRPPGGNAPGTLEVRLELVPESDLGRFNVRLDGTTVLANAGNGATTGPLSVSAGAHRITQAGASGTDLSNYRTFFGAGCSSDGSVTVRSCFPRVCTIANLFDPTDCRQECREERDLCLQDPDTLPRFCVQLLRICLASCN